MQTQCVSETGKIGRRLGVNKAEITAQSTPGGGGIGKEALDWMDATTLKSATRRS
mgnify:CR=1 FL=1